MYGSQPERFRQEFAGDFGPPPEFKPGLIDFKEPLDTKDQHLVSLANSNGFLAGRIAELEKANYELTRRNEKIEREVADLRSENKKYELGDRAAQAGYKSGSQLVEEVEEAIRSLKNAK